MENFGEYLEKRFESEKKNAKIFSENVTELINDIKSLPKEEQEDLIKSNSFDELYESTKSLENELEKLKDTMNSLNK